MEATTWCLVGLSVGAVMGMTGAGGALIAVPIFVSGMGASVHDATQNALWAVFFGSLMNSWIARNDVRWSWALVLVPTSWIASWWIRPLKHSLSGAQITLLILATAAWSLYTLWNNAPRSKINAGDSRGLAMFWRGSVIGSAIGTLNTLTGLGGGAILVPALLRADSKMTPTTAMSTSLGVIVFSAAGSLWIQRVTPPSGLAMGMLVVGLVGAATVTRMFLKRFPRPFAEQIRKWAFTGVVALTGLSLLWQL